MAEESYSGFAFSHLCLFAFAFCSLLCVFPGFNQMRCYRCLAVVSHFVIFLYSIFESLIEAAARIVLRKDLSEFCFYTHQSYNPPRVVFYLRREHHALHLTTLKHFNICVKVDTHDVHNDGDSLNGKNSGPFHAQHQYGAPLYISVFRTQAPYIVILVW